MNYRRLFTAVIALIVMVLPNFAFADTVMTVTPGLNGLYKTNQPIQINISIANNGAAVKDAVLMVKHDALDYYSEDNAIYQKKINLPANQLVETEIVIPGQMANNNSSVWLYSNGVKIASAKIQGVAVSKDFIGISVGEAPLTNGLPIWLETNMKNMVTLKYMAPTELPVNQTALGIADLIVMDAEKVGELTQNQYSTIQRWITLGGTLLLSGGAGAAEGQPFTDISPVLVTGKKAISGNWNGIRVTTAPVDITTGTFVDGEKVLTLNDTVLVARRNIGRGTVVYSAVGLEKLDARDNKVWEALLELDQGPVMAANYGHGQEISMGSLLNASANFLQLQPPSIGYLVGIWGLYVLLVVPGMYLLLKKYNKRDWAWFGVPVIAVVAATIIYYSAPLHKLNGPLGQTLAIIDVLDDQVAEIKADGSYVSRKGGKLVLADTGQGLIMPQVRYYGNNQEQTPIIEYTDKGIQVSYDKVGYLSLRQASLYKVVNDFGYINGEIKLSGNKITGQLTNQTQMNIEKCLLIFGDNVIELGEIPTNNSINIDVDVLKVKRFNWETNLKDWFGSNVDNVYQVHEAVATKESYSGTENNKGLQLIALAKEVPGLMQLQNTNAENISTAIIRQEVPLVVPDNGKIRLPSGFIPANIVESDGGLEQTSEGYMIHGSEVTVEFNLQLPVQHHQFDVQAVEISNLLVKSNYELSIFNWANRSWSNIKPNQSRLEGAKLRPYISEQNRMRLNIKKSADQYDVMPLPGLTVEGMVR